MRHKYTLQFITPCFCRGADGETIEPRASSIKGVLRFWFRAIGCFDGLEEMRNKEAEIFGGTINKDGKEISKSSPIKLKIISDENSISEEKYSFIPGKGIKYESLKHIDLEFIQRNIKDIPNDSMDKEKYDYLTIYSELLTLVSILGGIGARTRRGYGCFNILNQDGIKGKGIGKYLKDILDSLNKEIGNKSKDEDFYCIVNKENHTKKLDKYWVIERNCENDNESENYKYPFINKIHIKEIEKKHKYGDEKMDIYYNELKIIKDFTHERKSGEYIDCNVEEKNQLMDWLGCGGSEDKDRFASPVYVSICEYKQKSYLIITELNNTKIQSNDEKVKNIEDKLNSYTIKFINDILERC